MRDELSFLKTNEPRDCIGVLDVDRMWNDIDGPARSTASAASPLQDTSRQGRETL
jgi:hypothetical protein